MKTIERVYPHIQKLYIKWFVEEKINYVNGVSFKSFFFLPCAVWLKWEPEPVFPLYEEVFLAYKEKCTPGI